LSLAFVIGVAGYQPLRVHNGLRASMPVPDTISLG